MEAMVATGAVTPLNVAVTPLSESGSVAPAKLAAGSTERENRRERGGRDRGARAVHDGVAGCVHDAAV